MSNLTEKKYNSNPHLNFSHQAHYLSDNGAVSFLKGRRKNQFWERDKRCFKKATKESDFIWKFDLTGHYLPAACLVLFAVDDKSSLEQVSWYCCCFEQFVKISLITVGCPGQKDSGLSPSLGITSGNNSNLNSLMIHCMHWSQQEDKLFDLLECCITSSSPLPPQWALVPFINLFVWLPFESAFSSPDLPHHSCGEQNGPGSEQTGFCHSWPSWPWQCWAGQVKGGTGKEVATNYQIKYIETSPGENPPTLYQCRSQG